MQARNDRGGNFRAQITVKRSILRTLRLSFLQGWAWYRGNLIDNANRLAAFFPAQDIAYVRDKIAARKHWWFERDAHFHLRRQDGVVHLDKPAAARRRDAPCNATPMPILKLVSYNCQSLGKGSSRLQQLAEDMHSLDVSVAALQGTRWKSAEPRSEWAVRGIYGHCLYQCFSWGRPTNNNMLGVQILVSQKLFQTACVHTRMDPPRNLRGRLGGVRLVGRERGHELDDLFISAYAPQETDDAATRAEFFQSLLEMIHSVPRRTRVWVLGDFNGHVGIDMRSPAVGRMSEPNTNNNGYSLVQACESAGLLLHCSGMGSNFMDARRAAH